MKFILFVLSLQLFALTSHAAIVTSEIDSIERGQDSEPSLIKLKNGQVVFVDQTKEHDQLLSAFTESMVRNELIDVDLGAEHSVLGVKTNGLAPVEDEPAVDYSSMRSYDPTRISSTEAGRVFRRMRRDYQNESQCYNRAHIWAYEENNYSGLNSMKLFLFFTSRYIRNYRYHWWFHVTPMAVLTDGTWRTLDRRYSSGPLTLKTWTNKFIYSRRDCPIVYKYSSYRNHQQSEDCYLIPTSMYYWQPRDIDRKERTGYEKQVFFSSEIKHAYWEAF